MRVYLDEKQKNVKIELRRNGDEAFYTCSTFATATVSLQSLIEELDRSGVLDVYMYGSFGDDRQMAFDFEDICLEAVEVSQCIYK